MTSAEVAELSTDPSAIDIRSSVTKQKEPIIKENCTSLEVECSPIQSSSFAVHPIQHENIKKNSTASPDSSKVDIVFVPTDANHVVVKPVKIESNHTESLDHLYSMDWPWISEIYLDGDLVANGVLLDKSWVLIDRRSLGSAEEPLREHHIVASFGNKNSHLKINSPYEQISRVDCLQAINDSNVAMLHLEKPVEFNRHVLPSFVPSR